MKSRAFLPIATLGALLALAPMANADVPKADSPLACAFEGRQVTHVKPLYEKEQLGKATLKKLRGAIVYVQAERGLTAEWLGLNIQRHVALMRGSASMPGCPLDFDKLSVTVKPTKTGYAVVLAVKDRAQAAELLERARAIGP
jgi:hypothetical protein